MKNPGNKINDHKRRNLLIGLSSILGITAAAKLLDGNALSVALAHVDATDVSKGKPHVFSLSQLASLKTICQTVIPATQTPGAGDIDTHYFIDNQLHHCFDQQAQDSLVKVVSLIDESSNALYKSKFSELNPNQAHALLVNLDLSKNGFTKEQTKSFKFLKSLIVFGYYTSETGASQELKHERVPGGFKGSVPLSEVGAAWGSLDFF